jgi:hypothetical protein
MLGEEMNLPENLKPLADKVVELYRAGHPVVILDKDGQWLHGGETLQTIAQTGVPLEVAVIRGIDCQAFRASDLPEICEAVRLVWLKAGFPAPSV